jgi:DNA processing protein
VRETPSSPEAPLREGLALALLEGMRCETFRERVERHGSAAAAFGVEPRNRASADALARADDVLERAGRAGARVLLFGEPGYPERLSDLTSPPPHLFVMGDLTALDGRTVAIVGTRHASPAGERIALRFAAALTRAGAAIVSGMARGIDAAAHLGALDAGGTTVAVLGGGVDLPYPVTHRALHGRIVRDGLVLSEPPPGTRPYKGSFPRRNRIIAALAEAVIVVEAGDRSGALITARLALEMGREVGAVPGAVDSPRSVGSNRLLKEGAAILTDPAEVLEFADLTAPVRCDGAVGAQRIAASPPRSPAADAVLQALRSGAADLDTVARRARLPARELAEAVADLELAGVIAPDRTGELRLAT